MYEVTSFHCLYVTAIYLTCVMLMFGMVIACSTVLLYVRHSDPVRRAPVWFRRLVMHHIARMLLMKQRSCSYDSSVKKHTPDKSATDEVTPVAMMKLEPMESIANVDGVSIYVDHPHTDGLGGCNARLVPSTGKINCNPTQTRDHHATPESITEHGNASTSFVRDPVLPSCSTTIQYEDDSSGISYSRQDDSRRHSVDSVHQDNHFDDGNDETRTSFDNLLEWHALGRVLDRMFFVIFTLATIAVTMALAFIYAYCAPTSVTATPIS